MAAQFLHTMVRITDPERSRAFYEALGFTFAREMDIVRDGEKEANRARAAALPGARGRVAALLRPRPG